MGVHGLTTFIAQYFDRYKDKVYLRSSPVVIDGSNLMYFLYFNSPNAIVHKGPGCNSKASKSIPKAYLFGGDWEQYGQNVRVFFQQLKQCEITPVVLLDGAYASSKFETVYQRFRQSVKENVKGAFPGKSYTPVFLKTVFLEVLEEQKVIYYQTLGEADSTIAYVARLLQNCPILSSDSDFCIYINSKAVPLGSLKFAKATPSKKDDKTGGNTTSKVWTLQYEYVPLAKLCRQEFKLEDTRLLPLAAVILGNDVIQEKVFTNFNSYKSGGNTNSRAERISGVLKWLGKQKSLESGVKTLLGFVPEERRKETEVIINSIVKTYEGGDGESEIWKLVKKHSSLEAWIDPELDDTILDDPEPDNLPPWYIDSHIRCKYPTYLLNLHKNAMVLLPPQVEILSIASTHTLSLPIIQVTAGILCPELHFKAISRHRGKMETSLVPRQTSLPKYGHLPQISPDKAPQENIAALSHEKRLDILLETLGLVEYPLTVQYIMWWPPSCRIWIATLMYHLTTRLHSPLIFGRPHFITVAIAIFLNVIKNLLVNPGDCKIRQRTTPHPHLGTEYGFLAHVHQSTKQSPEKLSQVRDFYLKFEDFSGVMGKKFLKSYDICISNTLSEYMCLLFHTEMLNNLLGNPFKSPKVRCTLNNFFVYNFARFCANNRQLDTQSMVEMVADAMKMGEMRKVIAELEALCFLMVDKGGVAKEVVDVICEPRDEDEDDESEQDDDEDFAEEEIPLEEKFDLFLKI